MISPAPAAPVTPPGAAPSRKTLLGLAAAVVAAVLVLALPAPGGLSPEGQRLAAIFAAAVILWATEALPVAVTAVLVLLLQPLLGVADLRTAFQEAASPVFFFVLAMFCLAAAVTGAGLHERFARWLLARAGTDSRRVVVALMVGTAAISTIMSDVPACAIFMALGLGVLQRAGVEPGASRFGKAVMVGIPIAALIGGVATPAGSSVNILGIHFIEEHGGVRVPFLHWMALGVPMVLLLVPLACWVILRFFPPEVATVGPPAGGREDGAAGGPAAAAVAAGRAPLDPLSAREKKTLALISLMMVLWILGTWVPLLNVVLVALAGAVVMFLPGVGLLTWDEAQRMIGWDTLLMIGGVTSLGGASVTTGLAGWLVEVLLGGMESWSLVGLLLVIGAFTVVIHLALPIGPVVNAVLIPPIALLAISAGMSPALLALPVAFTASCAFLLPLDAVALITYSKGYYRMLDMLGPGAVISAVWVLWMTALVLLVGPWLGIL